MRSRLSREGRTTLPPIARGGPLGEAARWKDAGPGGSLRSHESPPYRTLNPHCNLESERAFAAIGGVPRVVGGGCDEHLGGFVADLGERSEREEDVLGRVRSTSELLRREERRVGLNQESIQRHGGGGHTQMFVLRIRHVARERGPVAPRGTLASEEGVTAEAVDHDALRRTLIQDPHRVRPRVSDMNHQRLARLVRKGDVGPERADLLVLGRKHPEPIQAAFPHGHHARVVKELLDPGRCGRVEPLRIVRMHPRGREHTLE
jgi:hypothetical protein